ncbi:unnamed protein product [Dimorphilus gyrociliatus]|uniref:Uncharacterized protein n=1 Tax=Dimorphilus gyrociliatus TaxID=2664684 RepID=A0A7I8VKF2_9ANNE|nr:unnamed protein product [Dimorphilus gyrociliatus]
MAPEVRELLEEQLLDKHNIDYPIPEVIMGGGFFFVLFLEKFVHVIYFRSQKNKQVSSIEQSQQDVEKEPNGSMVMTTHGQENHTDVTHDHTHAVQPAHSHVHFRSILFLLALSLHCVFEGIAVGLKKTEKGVWTMMAAICAHEIVVSFCLGLNLYKTYKDNIKRFVLCGIIYSIDSPIGVAIGTIITSTGGNPDKVDLINGILQGIAAGTFIYVTFFEILYGNLNHDTPLVMLLAMLVGFGVMCGLKAIPEGDEPDTPANATVKALFNMDNSLYKLQL